MDIEEYINNQLEEEMHKEILLNKLFEKPTKYFKIRHCKYLSNYRINKKGNLQRISLSYDDMSWYNVSWEQFNKDLKEYFDIKNKEDQSNNILKFQWNFVNKT